MENGNIAERKTNKQLASELNINVKTMRNSIKYATWFGTIDNNIGKERAEQFEKIICQLDRNKKDKVSAEQIMYLSQVSADEQIRIVDLILKHPTTAKQIINNAIPFCRVKTTVTLPVHISEKLEYMAVDTGLSKGKFIEKLLIDFCTNNDREDI